MAKSPKDPREIFEEFTEDYKTLFGEDLISIILYGSATGKAYRPGKSDINFMIVLSENGIDRLEEAFKTVAKWQKRHVAIPLFLTEHYIESSTDVFPIEYLGFQRHHTLVFGKDVLKDLAFGHGDLRLQCEREIKGKMLILRQAFLQSSGKAKTLREVVSHSLGAFAAIFEGLLHLKALEPSTEKRENMKRACEAFELDAGVFEKLLDIKEDKFKPGEEELQKLFNRYLSELRRLSKRVDSLGGVSI